MAVEELHFAPYIVESAASNPDFAVFLRHNGPYILLAPVANAEFSVFVQSSNYYLLSGRDTPLDLSLRWTNIYAVMAPAPVGDRPQVLQTNVYEIFGGKRNLTPFIKMPHTTVYELFTV